MEKTYSPPTKHNNSESHHSIAGGSALGGEGTNELTRNRIKLEKKIAIIMVVIIMCFFASWFPYAIISFYSSFTPNSQNPDPVYNLIAAYFAKSFFLWNPLVFIVLNSQLRKKLNILR